MEATRPRNPLRQSVTESQSESPVVSTRTIGPAPSLADLHRFADALGVRVPGSASSEQGIVSAETVTSLVEPLLPPQYGAARGSTLLPPAYTSLSSLGAGPQALSHAAPAYRPSSAVINIAEEKQVLNEDDAEMSTGSVLRPLQKQPLSLNGVAQLQNEEVMVRKLDREMAAGMGVLAAVSQITGTGFGSLMGMSFGTAFLSTGPLFPMFAGVGLAATALVSVTKKSPRPNDPAILREHAFTYAGIVATLKESRAICRGLQELFILDKNRAFIGPDTMVERLTSMGAARLNVNKEEFEGVLQLLYFAEKNMSTLQNQAPQSE